MPYITEEEREKINLAEDVETAGQLNWFITTAIAEYLDNKGECYQTYNDIIGALEGAKLEIYRRKISFYETRKLLDNGDVY